MPDLPPPMRWSIRNQILIPLLTIQAIAVTAATVTMATLAVRRTEREIISRINDVADTLTHGNFPYTESVLNRMRGLSGAHFIVGDTGGKVLHSSLPQLEGLPASLRDLPHAAHVDSLQQASSVLLDGTPYFAMSVRTQNGPPADSLFVLYPRTSLHQARWEAVMPSLLLGAASLGMMMLVTSWIANHISGRIRQVQRQVARIADGDFHEVDPGARGDEVADLTLSVNRMSAQLKEMQQTIHHSERARLLAQLGAGLAHQLRNSLTGARLSVQLHVKRHPDAAGDQTLSVALRQLALTEEQVRGLLSIGRVEQQPAEVCELRQMLDDVAFLVGPSCQHAEVCFSRPADDALGSIDVLADRSGLRAAILNLALNAIEAAGQGGSVAFEIHRRENEVALDVVDNGPGPPPELAETLCDAFVTGKPEGVGLGLALARQVASDHGGRLSWSRSDGQTRFRLALPTYSGRTKEADSAPCAPRRDSFPPTYSKLVQGV
jgi:signal transduction histidine kinase